MKQRSCSTILNSFLPYQFGYQNAVPKVRAELTRGHSHRFLSLVRVVLINVNRREFVQQPEYLPVGVRA